MEIPVTSQTGKRERGREAVQAALIDAACALLAESGPKAMTVRKVAARAGVNHGQVYHYFGGKEGLIRAAMRQLARRHLQNVVERSRGRSIPPALTLGRDPEYLRAVVRMVLDGDLATAALEIEEGVSVPRRVLSHLTELLALEQPSLDLKAVFAAMAALELGWAAMEPYVLLLADVGDEEEAASIRHGVKRIVQSLTKQVGLDMSGYGD